MGHIKDSLYVGGKLSAQSLEVPTAFVLDTSNAQHRFKPVYSQANGSSVSDEEKVVHTVTGTTGTVVSISAGVITACVGAATIDVDLHKNGSSILSAAIQIDSGDAAYAEVTGTISNSSLVQGDSLEIVVDETTGGGTQGQGLFVNLVIDEEPS